MLIINANATLQESSTSFGVHRGDLADQSDFISYPFMVECTLNDWGTKVSASYDSTLISTPVTERVMQQFMHIIKELSLAAEQDRLMCALNKLSPQDLQTL